MYIIKYILRIYIVSVLENKDARKKKKIEYSIRI